MNRKAQAEIIVTILIILLVLAAIVIVWQVISSTVSEGARQVPGQTDCLLVNVDVIKATAGDPGRITVQRKVGQGDLVGLKVYVQGEFKEDISDKAIIPKELETKEITLTSRLTAGDKVQITKVIGTDFANGRICEFMGTSVEGIIVS